VTTTARARVASRPAHGHVAPRTRPATAPERRPHLRLVTSGRQAAGDNRRRRAGVAIVGTTLLFALLFGVAIFQTVLAQNQANLDRLDRRVAEERYRYQRLRLDVARLESPARVVAAAQERLGMVPPPGVTYLSPSGPVADEVRAAAGGERAPVVGPEPEGGGTHTWAAVKPYLGGGG
jgi:cell division protein FtsL